MRYLARLLPGTHEWTLLDHDAGLTQLLVAGPQHLPQRVRIGDVLRQRGFERLQARLRAWHQRDLVATRHKLPRDRLTGAVLWKQMGGLMCEMIGCQ